MVTNRGCSISPGAGLGGMRHELTCRERRREGERVRLCLSVCVDAHRKDGNPLGWLALGRGARGRGFGRSSGVHFGWKKSVLITNCLSSALLNAKTAFRRQNQKDRDSRVDCLLETGCFNNKEEGSGRREKMAVGNKGLRDALLRGPKTFVLCNRKPSYSVLWSALGVARI